MNAQDHIKHNATFRYCCCCDSPAALLLTSVVQVEEVCNRSRVVPATYITGTVQVAYTTGLKMENEENMAGILDQRTDQQQYKSFLNSLKSRHINNKYTCIKNAQFFMFTFVCKSNCDL